MMNRMRLIGLLLCVSFSIRGGWWFAPTKEEQMQKRLYQCVEDENELEVEAILKKEGVDPNYPNSEWCLDRTPFEQAVRIDNAPVVKKFLEDDRVDPNARFKSNLWQGCAYKPTPLIAAIYFSNKNAVRALCECERVDLNKTDTPNGLWECVDWGRDAGCTEDWHEYGTPLVYAIRWRFWAIGHHYFDHIEVVHTLLASRRIDPNLRDPVSGLTPLEATCEWPPFNHPTSIARKILRHQNYKEEQ